MCDQSADHEAIKSRETASPVRKKKKKGKKKKKRATINRASGHIQSARWARNQAAVSSTLLLSFSTIPTTLISLQFCMSFWHFLRSGQDSFSLFPSLSVRLSQRNGSAAGRTDGRKRKWKRGHTIDPPPLLFLRTIWMSHGSKKVRSLVAVERERHSALDCDDCIPYCRAGPDRTASLAGWLPLYCIN